MNEQDMIQRLGIESWPEDRQQAALTELNMRIGDALDAKLTDQQRTEYQAIIDANQDVINAWLSQHAPEYKQTPMYQEILASYEEDPEKNDPAKIYASIAWTQVNLPDTQQVVDEIVVAYKAELV